MVADAFVLGRKVYEPLASYWPTATDDTGFAERTNSLPKYVASRTLKEPLDWNASLIKGDLAESVTNLKHQHRGNLISFGCGELAYELDKMKKELFELRFKARTAGAANPSRIRQLKRTIARVHTVRHERARQARKPRT